MHVEARISGFKRNISAQLIRIDSQRNVKKARNVVLIVTFIVVLCLVALLGKTIFHKVVGDSDNSITKHSKPKYTIKKGQQTIVGN